jgi:hypothetical protein
VEDVGEVFSLYAGGQFNLEEGAAVVESHLEEGGGGVDGRRFGV